MDDEKIKLAATLAAMQILLIKLYAFVYKFAQLSPQQVLMLHETMRNKMPQWDLAKTNNPTISNLLSGEVVDALKQFLDAIEKESGVEPKELSERR